MHMSLLNFVAFLMLVAALLATPPANALDIPTPRKTQTVVGGDGVQVAVQEWGAPDGKPILFVHAWSQSHLGWLPQLRGHLPVDHRLVTFDLRGHGNSEKRLDKAQYDNGDLWADDVNAIISTLDLREVTLVGWSYGSIVIGDYLAKYGPDRIAALNIVGGLTGIGIDRVAAHFGPALSETMKAFEPRLPTQALAMVAIAEMMLPKTLDKQTYGFLIATNMVVPPFVREAMTDRSADYRPVYETLDIPVLFTHGTADTGILPVAAEEGASLAPRGALSLYEGAGHAPHWADPDRFDGELSRLVAAANP